MLTQEQQEMVEKNHNLIYKFMHKHKVSPDYYGSAALGLCKAAMHYDPSFGTTFSTYAFKAMLQQYLTDKKVESKHVHNLSLDKDSVDDGNTTVKDLLMDKIMHFNLEEILYIEWLLKLLPLFDLKVVLYRLKGYTMQEIGDIMGCSKQAVFNHLAIIKQAVQDNRKSYRWKVEDSSERQEILKEIYELLY